jgi:hypothetical protein
MSDLVIFIVGTGVFAITTTATLLFGYVTFQQKAREDGVLVADGSDDRDDTDTQDLAASGELTAIPIDIARVTPSPILADTRVAVARW